VFVILLDNSSECVAHREIWLTFTQIISLLNKLLLTFFYPTFTTFY